MPGLLTSAVPPSHADMSLPSLIHRASHSLSHAFFVPSYVHPCCLYSPRKDNLRPITHLGRLPMSQSWYAHTPESKLPRSDSRLASATCRGICGNGRPCRRALASPAARRSSTQASSRPAPASSLHCWQHQDQASLPTTPVRKAPGATEVRRQASFDTLVDRIGGLDISEGEKKSAKHGRSQSTPTADRKRKTSKPSFFALLCFRQAPAKDDYYEVVRHKQRVARHEKPQMTVAYPKDIGNNYSGYTKLNNQRSTFIPKTISDETAALLQLELSRPVSVADEPGYIYMFQITEDSMSPAVNMMDSFLTPGCHTRSSESHLPRGFEGRKPFMVKIGRATNVHRRLASWSKQCGYTLSLLRFYPHVPSAASESRRGSATAAEQGVRKVPLVHRVERLIHIELAGRRVRQGKCVSCGREHREWFAVSATREGVRTVDEVCQRWVRWAEGHGS